MHRLLGADTQDQPGDTKSEYHYTRIMWPAVERLSEPSDMAPRSNVSITKNLSSRLWPCKSPRDQALLFPLQCVLHILKEPDANASRT